MRDCYEEKEFLIKRKNTKKSGEEFNLPYQFFNIQNMQIGLGKQCKMS